MAKRPWIVCLCGSTKFKEAYEEANHKETMKGHIVLSVGSFKHQEGNPLLTKAEEAFLDELHLRKIDLADEVLVLNVGGYIGQSTSNEMDYAIQEGKSVRFWERL
jgi:hypothetical protein